MFCPALQDEDRLKRAQNVVPSWSELNRAWARTGTLAWPWGWHRTRSCRRQVQQWVVVFAWLQRFSLRRRCCPPCCAAEEEFQLFEKLDRELPVRLSWQCRAGTHASLSACCARPAYPLPHACC